MKLIAKKPCSFGGRQFYIGDEIPVNFVSDAKMQEKMGIITIVNDMERVPGGESGTFFTQEQLDKMVAEAVDEAVNNTVLEMEQKQKELQEAAGVLQAEGFLSEGSVIIPVKRGSDGDNEAQMAVSATQEEIRQVFSIMQMNADEGAKAVANIMSENVLILLHAADSRKTIKDAAKKRADVLFMLDGKAVVSDSATDVNTTTVSNGTISVDIAANPEGADV